MPLHPFVAETLAQAAAAGIPALQDLPVEVGRKGFRDSNALRQRIPLPLVEDRDADGVPVRIYRPQTDKVLPALIYCHGGGWVIGDLETHDHVCRHLASQTDCIVIAVDYRLAPEHPYPAALDDCTVATQWVRRMASHLAIDASRIAIGGDSAGANLATCVCLKMAAGEVPWLVHQLLVYPVTDTRMDSPSYTENAEGYSLSREMMRWFLDHYIGAAARNEPLLAPLHAEDLSRLPPALIITAEFDPLRDEGHAYGARLQDAGVAVTCKCYDGMIHGFFNNPDDLEDSRDAISLAARTLKAAFS